MTGAGRRQGSALVLAVFALLALAALGHAALYLAGQEWAIAVAAARRLAARHAAETAAARTAAAWEWQRFRSLGVLEAAPADEGRLDGGVRYRAAVRRLARELYLIEAAGTPEESGGTVRVGRLLWALDPVARVAAFPAGLMTAGDVHILENAVVDGTRAALPPPGWTGPPCETFAAIIDSLYPAGTTAGLALGTEGAVTRGSGASLQGSPPILRLPDVPPPGLGPVDAAGLADLADRRVEGAVTPHPSVRDGGCDTGAAGNWGAPSDPRGPCGAYFPLVAGAGIVTVAGGEGQGILVVDGDLQLTGDARYAGILLVRGRLLLGERAALTGFAAAGTGVELRGEARAEASACAALRALSLNSALQHAFRIPQGNWIPLF